MRKFQNNHTLLTNCLCFFVLTFLLIACQSKVVDHGEDINHDVPKAFTDDAYSLDELKSSRSDDMVQRLFNELSEERMELKKLNEDIQKNNKEHNKLLEVYNLYKGNSLTYYTAVTQHLLAISDTILRQKIADRVSLSAEKHEALEHQMDSLLMANQAAKQVLLDRYEVLKISTTLARLEKYQRDNLPKTKVLEDMLNQEYTLTQRIMKLTPAF